MSDPVTRLKAALEGRYRIERELGEGGMATVYLADDLKHERKVALKVLKPELAAVVGAERFLAEIKTTANLQHPHILPLYDSGEADSLLFYVMPWVPGESLRQRLDREHQLPVNDAVRIATNMAEALDYAHRHGVIHRDIKPANVLLQDGKPVISDFGIALAVGAAGGGRLTETGLSLGTPHYMSPEQATGDLSVGAATDVYALGCVLYEMLVGEPPYTGSTAQAILGKIIAGEFATAAKQRASVPPNVDAAIKKALEKVPADRFRSATEFVRALAAPSFRHEADPRLHATVGMSWKWLALAMTASTVSFAAVAARAWSNTGSQGQTPSYRLNLALEGPDRLPNFWGPSIAMSPDGSRVAYYGPGGWWVRPLDSLGTRPVGDGQGFAFSPDGAYLARRAGTWLGRIFVSDLGGQQAEVVVDSVVGEHFDWSRDGWIYFATAEERGIARVEVGNGRVEALTAPNAQVGELSHLNPYVLPDDRGFLFTVRKRGLSDWSQSEVAVFDMESGDYRTISKGLTGRYVESGHLLIATPEGTLRAAGFDLETLRPTTDFVTVLQEVRICCGYNGSPELALSTDGLLLYVTNSGSIQNELLWVSRAGEREVIEWGMPGAISNLALSSDGQRLAVSVHSGIDPMRIWVKGLGTGAVEQVTYGPVLDVSPQFVRNDGTLLFVSPRFGNWDLHLKDIDAGTPAEVFLDQEGGIRNPHTVSDLAEVVFCEEDPLGSGDIRLYATASGVVTDVVATEYDECQPSLSPDGRWVAYRSDETGTYEIHVRELARPVRASWRISSGGGSRPQWSPSTNELFFASARGELLAVAFDTVPTFDPVPPVRLFSFGDLKPEQYAVSSDASRFVMVRDVSVVAAGEVVLVTNFFEELKRLVPN